MRETKCVCNWSNSCLQSVASLSAFAFENQIFMILIHEAILSLFPFAQAVSIKQLLCFYFPRFIKDYSMPLISLNLNK
jgi:hypothetical protein